MALLHEEDNHNHKDKNNSKMQRTDTCRNLKGMSHSKFVIVAKFGGHALCHLASGLTNVIKQGERQTKNLISVIFFLNLYLRWH